MHLIRGIPRYSIQIVDVARLNDSPYYRATVHMLDNDNQRKFEGMAESASPAASKLRAMAEAYERLCLTDYQAKQHKVNLKLPYGMGVGLRKSSALQRAWAEYWERRLLLDENFKFTAQPQEFVEDTPGGVVHLCALIDNFGFEGTGYGLTKAEALLSAQKSSLRKRDFKLEKVKFTISEREPEVMRLTPHHQAWMECYFVGHSS